MNSVVFLAVLVILAGCVDALNDHYSDHEDWNTHEDSHRYRNYKNYKDYIEKENDPLTYPAEDYNMYDKDKGTNLNSYYRVRWPVPVITSPWSPKPK